MNKEISLVLSGGGARGIAHIGVIEALESKGFHIHSITGTSMGAMVGGVYALGKLQEYKDWLIALDKMKVFQLVDFSWSMQGFIKGEKVLKKMKDFIPDGNIEDLPIQFKAVATDLVHKEEVVFSEGSIFDAIRASMSIPTVFTPVKKGNRILVDGGVLNNIPIKYAIRKPNDFLVVVNVNADCEVFNPFPTKKETQTQNAIYQKKLDEFYKYLYANVKYLNKKEEKPKNKDKNLGYFELINLTLNLMMNQADKMLLERYHPDLVINISRDNAGTFDFFRANELMEIGRLSTYNALSGMDAEFKKLTQ